MYWDVRYRKIPNAISFMLMGAGLTAHFLANGWPGFLNAFFGLAIGCAFFLLFYLFKMMGAGDVKLMAGIGAIIGNKFIASAIVLTVLCGGVLALFYLLAFYHSRKKQDKVGSANIYKEYAQKKSVPYGIAIVMGTIITLIINFDLL